MKFQIEGTVEGIEKEKGFEGKQDTTVVCVLARLNGSAEFYKAKLPDGKIPPKIGDKFSGLIEVRSYFNDRTKQVGISMRVV
jgi:hypothetical protein